MRIDGTGDLSKHNRCLRLFLGRSIIESKVRIRQFQNCKYLKENISKFIFPNKSLIKWYEKSRLILCFAFNGRVTAFAFCFRVHRIPNSENKLKKTLIEQIIERNFRGNIIPPYLLISCHKVERKETLKIIVEI